MTNLEAELVQWSSRQTLWQQDLLRRIASGDSLSSDDYHQYAKAAVALETKKGAPWYSEPKVDEENSILEPLTEAHLTSTVAGDDPVAIARVLHIHGANDLAPGACLEFAPNGLTIIAGKNGSGKSGLTRILKQVAASRSTERILPNVFRPQVRPKAVVSYSVGHGSQVDDLSWEFENESFESPMQRVRIFDAHAANVHLSGANEIAYIPPTLQILGEYTEALQEIAALLENERLQINLKCDKWPELEKGAGLALFENLGRQGALDVLKGFSDLTSSETKELEDIPAKLAELSTTDPAAQAIKARNIAKQFGNLAQSIELIAQRIGVLEAETARSYYANVESARAGVEDARQSLSQEGMLSGTGNEPWRAMWLAVKEFAESGEHKHTFPQDDQVCPLCVQPLEPEAEARFSLFANFMTSEAQKELLEAQKLWNAKCETLSALSIQTITTEENIELVGTYDEALAASLRPNLEQAELLRNSLVAPSETSESETIPDPQILEGELLKIAKEIRCAESVESEKAKSFASLDSSAEAVTRLSDRQQSLSLQQGIAAKLKEIGAEHDRRILISILEAAKAKCGTVSASRKNSELSKEYVTAICERFSAESQALGLQRVPVELVFDRSSRGISFIKVAIKDVNSASVNGVLSEGEQRVAAIAGFFADLTESGDLSTLVFDDPVSSLDQEFRVKVAQRLLQEAEKRQVLVFTHDFTFVQYLYEEKKTFDKRARATDLEPTNEIHYLHIARSPDGAGAPTNAEVWRHVSVKERVGRLKARQQTASALYNKNDLVAYEKEARDIVGAIRETWEVFVEQELLNNVVTRHERSVQTQRLSKLLQLRPSDIAAVDLGMTIDSRYMTGHAAPFSDASAPVEPQWILDEIEMLAGFRTSYLSRKGD